MADPTTFERRQRVLALLHSQPGVRVTKIATLLRVSEGTIRNDLNALAKAGQLERVRGGGVPTDEHPAHSPAFDAQLRLQTTPKRQMARWAAELVQDRDTILLDASTSVFFMAQFLADRRGLTIVTNGIEVGRKLAQESSHTVMLLGGILNTDGVPVTDLVSEAFLQDLHIKTAFVSCAGFSLEAGLTETDIHDAQLKSKMIAGASSVVALVDSTKFGLALLAPFARTDQVNHIFTDCGLDSRWIEQVRSVCPTLTICDDNSATDYTSRTAENHHYRIGFANLGENMPFSIDVRRGIERAAKAAGNIDLIVADNHLNGQVALEVADRLLATSPDLVIEYQIDEQVGSRIMDKFRRANIPVIAVDIPIVGATYFGVNHYQAGLMAGEALGEWIRSHWAGQIDQLVALVEPRAGTFAAARIQGQLDGLQSIVGPVPESMQTVLDCGNTSEKSEKEIRKTLKAMPDAHRIAVISFNDDAALGALNAACRLERESDVIIVGQGADRRVRSELHNANSRIVGSTAYQPELYGEKLIQLAQRILRGEPVPPAVHMEHAFIRAGYAQ
jgi:ribose transport system substrate-binding protein